MAILVFLLEWIRTRLRLKIEHAKSEWEGSVGGRVDFHGVSDGLEEDFEWVRVEIVN